MHDRLAAVDHFKVPRQRRRSPHHRRSFPVYDPCLLTVRRRRIALAARLGIKGRQIERDARKRRALPLLLGKLDVPNAMLPRTVWVQSAEEFTQHVVLPWQERERLARVLPLAVSQDLLKEVNDAQVLRLALGRQVTRRGL